MNREAGRQAPCDLTGEGIKTKNSVSGSEGSVVAEAHGRAGVKLWTASSLRSTEKAMAAGASRSSLLRTASLWCD